MAGESPSLLAPSSCVLVLFYKVSRSIVSQVCVCVEKMTLTKRSVAMYIIARMLLGVGIVFAIISGSSLIGELGYPKERPFLTSLFNASYFIGSIIAAAIATRTVEIAGDWSWRVPSLLQICPSILQICFVLCV
jgi:MFS family permease